jgi:peroxiredoxin
MTTFHSWRDFSQEINPMNSHPRSPPNSSTNIQRSRRDKETPGNGPLMPGTAAPRFELNSTPDQTVQLSDFRGRPVVLVFYPADWSPVCGDQLALYNEILPEFSRHGAQLVGLSVDGIWCHLAYARDRKLRFPLLSDFEAKGAVARDYGVYRAGDGVCERALFVLDGKGIVHWSHVSPLGVNPGADGILRALETLATKEDHHAQAR